MLSETFMKQRGFIAPREIGLAECMKEVCAAYGTTPVALRSRFRDWRVAHPRQVYYWLAKQLGRFSYPQIGIFCGNRDHTTIMHGVRAVEARREQSPSFAKETDAILSRLTAANFVESLSAR